MQRLDSSVGLQSQIVNADDRNAYNEMQANLCSVMTVRCWVAILLPSSFACLSYTFFFLLFFFFFQRPHQSCIRRLKGNVAMKADTIMSVLLKVMEAAAKSSTVLEDAFLTVGAVTAAVEADFVRYMERFTPILYQALSNHEEHQMCGIAVGIVGDICRALNESVQPYCDSFMNLLLQNLQSPVLHRNVKPAILSCFGDIALAIGGAFEPYLEFVMIVLQQASQLKAPKNNYDMIDYVNQLREGIFEAYVGITQGLKGGNKGVFRVPRLTAEVYS